MANYPGNPVWPAEIYQFSTTDPVEGGENGIDNRPLKELADRTEYLRQQAAGSNNTDVILLRASQSQPLANASYIAIPFDVLVRDDGNILNGVALPLTTLTIPAGYRYARITGANYSDGISADNVFSVAPVINGDPQGIYSSVEQNHTNASTTSFAGGTFTTPFIPVVQGDQFGMAIYSLYPDATFAGKGWLQLELQK